MRGFFIINFYLIIVKSLTFFGEQLSEATRKFEREFNTSVKHWPNEYTENYNTIEFLRQKISLNPKILIIGELE